MAVSSVGAASRRKYLVFEPAQACDCHTFPNLENKDIPSSSATKIRLRCRSYGAFRDFDCGGAIKTSLLRSLIRLLNSAFP